MSLTQLYRRSSYKLYLEAATLQSISRAKMLEISPWNFILVLLRISGCESQCDVDIRMALQSDLIKAVFILRRPGHFILWPTFNFKLKPLLAPHNGACWRCQLVSWLAKCISGNITQHIIFNRQIQFANNNTSPVNHEWMQYIVRFILVSLCVIY